MKKLNVAIIGQGRSGRDIHGSFFKSEKNTCYSVVAVIEKDEQRRKMASSEYPGCEVYESYTEIFARNDIDLVVNASYSNEHYKITKDLLENGFNVLVEKPFSANQYECNDLIRIANEKQVISTPYSLDGCFEEEFELFYKILRGEEQHKSYEDFIAPVFVINAISRSLESGNEEVVRRF